MKRIITILIAFALYLVPAQAQVWQALGSAALKGAGNAVLSGVTTKIEEKAENVVSKKVDKVLDKVFGDSTGETDSLNAVTGTRIGTLGQMFTSVGESIGTALEGTRQTGTATLRDFTQINAARKEHNATLVYDDWD